MSERWCLSLARKTAFPLRRKTKRERGGWRSFERRPCRPTSRPGHPSFPNLPHAGPSTSRTGLVLCFFFMAASVACGSSLGRGFNPSRGYSLRCICGNVGSFNPLRLHGSPSLRSALLNPQRRGGNSQTLASYQMATEPSFLLVLLMPRSLHNYFFKMKSKCIPETQRRGQNKILRV